ncbi:MAG: DoxX family protein, partial [bacterium]
FGGFGFSATMDYFVGNGLPAAIAFLIIVAESFGALSLILGFLSKFAAFGISLIMLGAIFLVHFQHGFFMNWFGTQQNEGFEYHLLALGLGIATMIAGGGKWSVDKLIAERFFFHDEKSVNLHTTR